MEPDPARPGSGRRTRQRARGPGARGADQGTHRADQAKVEWTRHHFPVFKSRPALEIQPSHRRTWHPFSRVVPTRYDLTHNPITGESRNPLHGWTTGRRLPLSRADAHCEHGALGRPMAIWARRGGPGTAFCSVIGYGGPGYEDSPCGPGTHFPELTHPPIGRSFPLSTAYPRTRPSSRLPSQRPGPAGPSAAVAIALRVDPCHLGSASEKGGRKGAPVRLSGARNPYPHNWL